MKEYLLIRLGSQLDHPLHWLVWHSDEGVLASGTVASQELAQLSTKAAQRDVIVLVPAADVQLKTAILPSKWNRKLQQALPFMLEEDIIAKQIVNVPTNAASPGFLLNFIILEMYLIVIFSDMI